MKPSSSRGSLGTINTVTNAVNLCAKKKCSKREMQRTIVGFFDGCLGRLVWLPFASFYNIATEV